MTQQVPVQSAVYCSQCGRSFSRSDLVLIAGNLVCGDCKSAFLSRVVAGTASAGRWQYGGVWARFGARMIDGFALAVVYIPLYFLFVFRQFRAAVAATPGRPPQLGTILGLEMGLVLSLLVMWLIYEVPMLKYWGATLGKMACGLKVVRSDGGNLSWGVSLGRYFMYDVVTAGVPYLNTILILISSILAGVDEEKRAIHDRVCDTRVVYKRSLASA